MHLPSSQAGAMRRVGMGWEAGLRQYPDLSLAPGTSRLRHYLAMRDIAGQVDDECGGLLHVEMAENGQVSNIRRHQWCRTSCLVPSAHSVVML